MRAMKTIKRELAHVGMFGQDGTKITKQDLADVAETFDGKGPISLGHKLADWMPKFGNTKSLVLSEDGESLTGELEINDVLADAVDEKYYEDLSVGLKSRAADGKRYLHHVAFLGAVPPKIRDLKVFSDLGVMFCGDEEGVVLFSDTPPAPASAPAAPDDVATALQRLADKGRSGWALRDVLDSLDGLVTAATEMLLGGAKIPDSLRDQVKTFADQLGKQAGTAGEEEDVEVKEELEATKADLEEKNKELADLKAESLVSAKEGIKTAMKGRIPVAKQGLVLELADKLSDSGAIELADEADPTKKEKVSGIECLRRVLESISLPVNPGRTDLGDGGEDKPLDLSSLKGKF
jgi:hypothetical protein